MKISCNKKVFTSLLSLAIIIGLIAGCGNSTKGSEKRAAVVTASGSTALLPLLKPAQEEFMRRNARVTVNISGGGSFTGLNQVSSGAVNIGNSDVIATAEFKNKGLVDHPIVVIPFIFIANPSVSVDSLTQQQYIDILSGKITNWKDVGGADQLITIVHRSKASGSRATITDVVLKGASFSDNAVIQDSNGAVRAVVASTPGAIGYVDAAYADNTVKTLAYNGVKYSSDAVVEGKYPLWTYGRMYTKGEATGATKAFIEYVLSKEFQESFVEKNGFIPVTRMKR